MILVNATVPVVNNYHTTNGNTTVQASVSNNNEQLPVSFISHNCTKNLIRDSYSVGNPNPHNYAAASTDEILALSAFLQMQTWPLCPQMNACKKPTIIHRPDICVVYKVDINTIPVGCNMFRIPIVICEVEGSKDVWGSGEQESKAMEEACYSLPFIPENHIIFAYTRRFEFIVCKRNPYTGTIDTEKETIHLQQDGDILSDKLFYICKKIITILVKQLTDGKRLIEIAIPHYRQMGWDGVNIYHPYSNVCPTCWFIQTKKKKRLFALVCTMLTQTIYLSLSRNFNQLQ